MHFTDSDIFALHTCMFSHRKNNIWECIQFPDENKLFAHEYMWQVSSLFKNQKIVIVNNDISELNILFNISM